VLVQRGQESEKPQDDFVYCGQEYELELTSIRQLYDFLLNMDSVMNTVVELVAEIFGVDKGTGYRITLGLTLIFVFTFMFIMILRAFGVIGGSSKRGKRSVVILGVSDVGKTLIFSHLTSGHGVNTYTSMKENALDGIVFREGGRKFRVIDLPGADRIRKTYFEQHMKKEDVVALVYVINSSTFQKDCRETSEFLYDVLSHPSVVKQRKRLPLLIVCNKQDSPLSKGTQVIRKGLEKELSVLNKTRAASLESIDGTSGKRLLLTGDSDEFKFENLRQNVEFVECVATGDLRLEGVKDWLKQL